MSKNNGSERLEFLKQAEKKENEEWLWNIIHHSSELHYMHSSSNKLMYVSPQSYQLLGYYPEELDNWTELLTSHPVNEYGIKITNLALKTGNQQPPYQLQLRKKDGSAIWVKVTESPVKGNDGTICGIVGSLSDITAEKEAAEKLEESNARLMIAMEAANEGKWEYFLPGDSFIIDDKTAQMFGFDLQDAVCEGSWVLDQIHPDQRERVFKSFEDYLEGKIEAFSEEYQVKHGKGHYIWVTCHAKVLSRDEQGNILLLVGILRDISNRKQVELDLRVNRNNLLRAEKVAGFGHWELNINTNTIHTSEGARSIYGMDEKEMSYEIIKSIPLAEYREALNNEMKGLIHENKNYDIEFRIKRPSDGIIRDIHSVAEYDKSLGIVFGIIHDISEIKKTQREERLAQKEKIQNAEKLRLTVEAANLGLYDLNIKTGLCDFTPEYASMLGYSPVEFTLNINKWVELLHPDDKMRVRNYFEKYILGEIDEYNIEFRMKNASGSWCWISSRGEIVEYDDQGNSLRMLGTHSDISKLKEYELELEAKNKEIASQNEEYAEVNEELQLSLQELRETNVQLEEAKEKAEESDRLKSAFLANMSHEIRTPMNSILGFSDLLTQHNLSDEKRRKFSKLVNNSGEQLMRLINDIIDISKIESNQLEVDKKWCKVNELIDEIVTAQKQNKNFILKESLKLNITKRNDIDSVILTDPFRFKQIVDNLLNNAIKFTDEGSIEFGYEIRENSGDSFIEFFIKDSGVGIPEKSHGDIFKRFVQADNHKQKTGTGLGLSITKGLVELLGGEIWLDSAPGKGSTFYFTLPYYLGNEKQVVKKAEINKYMSPDLKGQLIYVAEDDTTSFLFIVEVLSITGAKLEHFKNGQDLLDQMEKKIPNLILLDINMPVLNGIETVKELRTKYKLIPVIAQTAYAMAEEREICLTAGCNDYIAKPLNQMELLLKISNYIGN